MNFEKLDKFIDDFNKKYGNTHPKTRINSNIQKQKQPKTIHKREGNNINRMDDFIKEFSKSCFYKEPTFMEITKYPHYEKVCSNILSFYFDINREHNFGDLILRSFLKSANIQELNIEQIEVYPEYGTLRGNSIDLVLYNDDIAIGIENKIKANVYNDLRDYAETIDAINSNSYKIILSLKDESKIANENGYINVTYDKFLKNVRELTKDVWDTTNKWHIFLDEFIKTMENLKEEL